MQFEDVDLLFCHVLCQCVGRIDFSRSSSTLTARTAHVEFNALCLLSWAERSKMAIDLCDAVMYLHSLNPPILHRDIKPGNVLLDSKGRMYKLDVEALPLYVIIHTHTHTH